MGKRVILTSKAPPPIGPYSQAVEAAGFLFCSGQIPLDPNSGEMVAGDALVQTRQVLVNLGEVLRAAGSGWKDVLKATVYVTDLADFPKVNAVFGEFFPMDPPARAVVQVSALPKGAQVEIDCWALMGKGPRRVGQASSRGRTKKSSRKPK